MSNLHVGDVVVIQGELEEQHTDMLAVVMKDFNGHGALEINSPIDGELLVSDIDGAFVVLAKGADPKKSPGEEIMRLLGEYFARLALANANQQT